jgi:PIN domain nuclease of toxin-antitoxin system
LRFLLDTHALLWWFGDDPRLSSEARDTIGDSQSSVYVSAATVWEMSIKQNLGKLKVPNDIKEKLKHYNFQSLSISLDHGIVAGELPRHHGDPFDRMLIAQAQIENLTLVTRGQDILKYDVPTLLA